MKYHFLLAFSIGMLAMMCKSNQTSVKVTDPSKFKNYISAFTYGSVKAGSPIRIYFAQKAVEGSMIGGELPQNQYSIIPKLNGKAIWENDHTLQFVPEPGSIVRKMDYVMNVSLKEIFKDVPDSLSQFNFRFQFLPITVAVDWDFPRVDTRYEGNMMIEGIMSSTEALEDAASLVRAEQKDGPHLEVEALAIEGSENQYLVTVHKIIRKQQNDVVDITWHKDPENQSDNLQRSFNIPSIDQFVVTGIREDPHDPRCLLLFFSDLLEKNQDLKGIISVNKDSVKTSIVADRDRVHVSFNTEDTKHGELVVSTAVRSMAGKNLSAQFTHRFDFDEEKPLVRALAAGTIIPNTGKVIFPFEAINLKKVDVEIFKLFSNNVLYNMHLNEYGNDYELLKLGRVIKHETIDLITLNETPNIEQWVSYGLDLTKLITPEPGAMYDVRIMFRPQYSDYHCVAAKPVAHAREMQEADEYGYQYSMWQEYGSAYSFDGLEEHHEEGEGESEVESGENGDWCYDYDNPCCPNYYSSAHFLNQSILASNLSMVVKSSNEHSETYVTVYNVLTGKPVSSVKVLFYDQQLQLMGEAKTNGSGQVVFEKKGRLNYVVAQSSNQFAYLRVDEARALPTSEFDLSGVSSQHGLKASIYTERGVWRPGDTIHYNVILSQLGSELPAQLPIQIELKNPKGQVVFQQKIIQNLSGLYYCRIPTASSWITGNYESRVTSGASIFSKSISIETVKPNRMKTDWTVAAGKESPLEKIAVHAAFLHGAPAASKKITAKVYLSMAVKKFKKFKDFSFEDPKRRSGSDMIYLTEEGRTDANGDISLDPSKVNEAEINGMGNATFVSEIMDEGGDVSTDYYNQDIEYTKEYVGIKMPETYYNNYYENENINNIEVVCVDRKGNPVAGRTLEVSIDRTDWNWWYEVRRGQSYYSNDYAGVNEFSKTVTTNASGKASFNFRAKKHQNYYLHISNNEADQTAGSVFYTGWSDDDRPTKDFIQVMNVATDRENYKIGDKVNITLPGAKSGSFVIHLIRDNAIIHSEVITPGLPHTTYSFSVTKEMFPNIYVDATFIQGMQNKVNDLPLRLYGIVPVMVEDSSLRLRPVIKVDDKVRPEEEFTVEISEAGSSAMAYQLMIVDEGLLNINRFKTPDPYRDMFQKEAMKMYSWDNFDEFIGNDLKGLSKIFSIGGDEKKTAEELAKQQRFKPVVMLSGPQYLEKGAKKTHKFRISNYIGSVRVMAVCNNLRSYGSAERSIFVRNELASQITMPRVVSVADKIMVPVTLFKYDDKIKTANVQLRTEGPVKLKDQGNRIVNFNDNKEVTVWFELQASMETGSAKVICDAVSGSFNAHSDIAFYLDNPNPYSTSNSSWLIEPGASKTIVIDGYGTKDTRKAFVEISSIGLNNAGEIAERLIQYPHGCIEQTTSAAFPQLYISDFSEATAEQLREASLNVSSAIKKLQEFQLPNGAMTYWPGTGIAQDYCSSYVFYFISEARKKGYQVPEKMYLSLAKFLSTTSNNYANDGNPFNHTYSDFNQAYRLYVLAQAQLPEWGAMNRLRVKNQMGEMAKWLLAGAYATCNKQDMARQIYQNLNKNETTLEWNDYYYGSDVRDQSLVSSVLFDAGDKDIAIQVMTDLIGKVNKRSFLNTQESAVLLNTISKIFGKNSAGATSINCSLSWNGSIEDLSTNRSILRKNIKSDSKNTLILTNKGSSPVTVSVNQTAKVISSDEISKSDGISLNVDYVDSKGNKLDISNLRQGQQVTARVTVRNSGHYGYLSNIALTAVFPAGFELANLRLGKIIDPKNSNSNYSDYRDDRVMHYFDLASGDSRTFNIPMIAAYAGYFQAPMMLSEVMYRPSINAKLRSGKCRITMQ